MTSWNDVVELPAAASAALVLTSLASVALAAWCAVEPVRGSAAESAAVNAVTATVKILAVHV